MRIGVQLPEVERVVRWDEVAAMARRAESLGYDSLWVGDHLLYRSDDGVRGPWEAWTQLAAIGAVTDRVEIGPLVAALPFHEPAILAKQAATVDEISQGRLVVGVGAGWNRVEFAAFGLPYDRRDARFEEAFHLVRRLLAGEEVTHDGEFYRLDRCVLLPPSARAGGPPLLVGSNGPRMLSITRPHVASWNTWFADFENDPSKLPALVETIDDACRKVGRDPGTLEKTTALLLGFTPEERRRASINPIRGSAHEIASALDQVSQAGIAHVQLVLDPITEDTVEMAAEAMDAYRARYR